MEYFSTPACGRADLAVVTDLKRGPVMVSIRLTRLNPAIAWGNSSGAGVAGTGNEASHTWSRAKSRKQDYLGP